MWRGSEAASPLSAVLAGEYRMAAQRDKAARNRRRRRSIGAIDSRRGM